MIEEVEYMNVILRNQAYETAWKNIYKQRYIEQLAQALVILSFLNEYNTQYEMSIKAKRGYMFHTSDIANAWPPKHTNELARRTAVVTDWYNVSQSTVVLLYDLVEDIHQAVGR